MGNTTMCFKENVSFFKTINLCLFSIHLVALIACIVVITSREFPLTLYYKMEVTHGQFIDIYPIYAPLFTHGVGMLFHLIFALMAQTIVDQYFAYNSTNPLRWFMKFSVDGSALVGLMLIHGFHTAESVVLILTIYAAVIGFSYYQDHYLNPDSTFRPDREPHTFAIPLHLVMIFLIIGKASEHTNDDKSVKIAIITLISLVVTLVSHVIQKFHIAYHVFHGDDIPCEDVEDEYEDDGTDTRGESSVLENVAMSMDKLDVVLDDIGRGIQYETYYYADTVLFATTITWFIINITETDQELH
jgi:hypothetical protein